MFNPYIFSKIRVDRHYWIEHLPHSPKNGVETIKVASLAQVGAPVVDMQVAGHWKSSQMPVPYATAELTERGAIARLKDGKR